MFGGLRPFEAARLSWEQVNLVDGEIRLKGQQTKTGKGRIVEIWPSHSGTFRRDGNDKPTITSK
jgi:integrase